MLPTGTEWQDLAARWPCRKMKPDEIKTGHQIHREQGVINRERRKYSGTRNVGPRKMDNVVTVVRISCKPTHPDPHLPLNREYILLQTSAGRNNRGPASDLRENLGSR